MRTGRIPTWLAVALFALLAALWLNPILLDPTGVPFWRNAEFTDLLISHWPNAIFLHRAVQTWRQLPLWNPTILSGYPFLADPLASLWYPPAWIPAVFPNAITFNLLFWLHLIWAGIGMQSLLKSEGFSDHAALLGGVVFAGAPKWIAHIGLGHIGLISAVSWTPWLLLGTRTGITAVWSSNQSVLREFSKCGWLLAIIFFADPRWLFPGLLLLLLYALHVLGGINQDLRGKVLSFARWAFLTGLIAFGAAAGFASALLLFVRNSTRTLIEQPALDPFALKWVDLADVLSFHVDQPEKLIYMGAGAAFFVSIGILMNKRRSWFWPAAGLAGIGLSMGGNLPFIGKWLQALPLLALLRVPPRWFFLTILASAYFAAVGFEALIAAPIRSKTYSRSLLVFGVLGAAVYALSVIYHQAGLNQLLLMTLPALLLVPLILLRRQGWLHPRTFLIASVAVLTIEFGVVGALVLETRTVPDTIVEQDAALASQLEPYGEGRVFSPSYSVDPFSAALEGVELADGVHPLQLERYWLYMARALGFDPQQYSVTLPPFQSGDPDERWPIDLDPEALGKLNIKTIVAAYPLEHEDLRLISGDQERYVYALVDSRPRAWVEGTGGGEDDWQPARLTYWSPNRIELVGQGPGRLVLSEIAYPGWQVRVDGEETADVIVDGLLRGVQLEAGDHRVSYAYRPTEAYIGAALTLMTLLAAAFLQVRR